MLLAGLKPGFDDFAPVYLGVFALGLFSGATIRGSASVGAAQLCFYAVVEFLGLIYRLVWELVCGKLACGAGANLFLRGKVFDQELIVQLLHFIVLELKVVVLCDLGDDFLDSLFFALIYLDFIQIRDELGTPLSDRRLR